MRKRLAALFLAVVLVAVLGSVPAAAAVVSRTGQVKEKMAQNSDTVGWLRVPGTSIDDVILKDPGETAAPNTHYLRRNFAGEYDWNGSYFADYRTTFGGGAPIELSRSTTIYGNSFNDDPENGLFSALNRYRDPSFLEESPIIYFSTQSADMAWQVIAVSVMEIGVPYNLPDLGGGDREEQTLEALFENSLYSYEGSIKETDKLLILSTVDFSRTPSYPNDNRLVIVAKLVRSYPAGWAENALPEDTVISRYGPPTRSQADR